MTQSSVSHSLFMRAARRVATERTPVWFMRQAGRVLPEYRAIRERMTLLEICRHPELCTEVTLQPIQRFEMDAAILFADLMHPLVGIGIDLELTEHVGPVIAEPFRTELDLARIRALDSAADLPYVLDSIRLIKRALGGRIPLIGFVGAPFTLASYLVEGRPSRDFLKTKQLMYARPDLWASLMSRLADVIVSFATSQVEAGVDVLQVFDSWIGCVSPRDYEQFVRPAVRQIFERLTPLGVPLIHFGVNTAMLLPQMKDDGGTILGADWRIPLDEAWRTIGYDKGIQGNLDPAVLLAPRNVIDGAVKDVLTRAAGRPGHIFNLGHGLHPQTPLDGVQRAVEAVREFSARPVPPNRAELAGAR